MKKKNITYCESAAYESPQIHVFELMTEGVLCSSPGSIGGGDGGTEDNETPDWGGDLDFTL